MDTLVRTRRSNRVYQVLWAVCALAMALGPSAGATAQTPMPTLKVWLTGGGSVDAYNWPTGSTLELTIDDPVTLESPDFSTQQVTVGDTAIFWVGEHMPSAPGYLVKITDGIAAKQHTVQTIRVTTVDPGTEKVFGQAEPGALVSVCAHLHPGCNWRRVNADGAGNWVADYSIAGPLPEEQDTFDFAPGSSLDASRTDEDGDNTTFGFEVPSPPPPPQPALPQGWHEGPFGEALASGCSAYGWTYDPDDIYRDVQVRVLVDDMLEPVSMAPANLLGRSRECPDDTCVFSVPLWGLIAPGAEHKIVVQAWDKETSSWIDLSGTGNSLTCLGWPEGEIDYRAGEVTAPACVASGWVVDPDDRLRDVQVEIYGNGSYLTTTYSNLASDDSRSESCPDLTCNFEASIWGMVEPAVPLSIYIQSLDLETGSWVSLGSSYGSLTCFAEVSPTARFTVFPEDDTVQAWDWPLNAVVDMTIDDPTTPNNPDYGDSATVGPAPWDDSQILAFWKVAPYDVKPGDLVTLIYGPTVSSYVVEPIVLTGVDPAEDTITGTAQPGETVYVWQHGQDGAMRTPQASLDGSWLADFTTVEFDLLPGTCGRAEVRDEGDNATAVDWCGPYLRAFPEGDRVDGYNWPADQAAYLEVGGLTFPATADSDGHLELVLTGYDLRQGNVLRVTSGDIVIEHTVRQLFVTATNVGAQTVAGSVDGEAVRVHVFSGSGDLNVDSDESGYWLADFSAATDPVLFPGGCGAAEAWGEGGNSTIVDWCLPIVIAFPEHEAVETMLWPAWAQLTLSIDRQGRGGDAELERTVTVPQGDLWSQWVRFDFADVYDLQPGDVVTVTDGVTARTHVVQNLSVTEVNGAADTVGGTADAGAIVTVWPHGYDQTAKVEVETSDEGTWIAAFAPFDLTEGTGGRSQIRDEAGNATAVDWQVPNPRFTVFPEWEWMDAYDWPDGTVSVSVAGKGECSAEMASSGGFFNGAFPEGCDVAVGDMVSFDAGTMHREHTVRNLAITSVDEALDTVTGTADQYAPVHVWAHEYGQYEVRPSTQEGTTWVADFVTVGFNLLPGMSGRAQIDDVLGNATAVDWSVPNPHLIVQITEDWVAGQSFLLGAELTYDIYDSTGETTPRLSGTMQADTGGNAFAWVGDQVDLVPGNYVVVSDGTYTRDLVLEELTFEVFDLANGTLQGTAPPPAGRRVWVGIGFENDTWEMDVFTDSEGNWPANFGPHVPSSYQWAAAQVFDLDGDASEVRPERVDGLWIAAYTFDPEPGTLAVGTYPYHFEFEWGGPEPGSWSGQSGDLEVDEGAPDQDGYVLLRGTEEIHGVNTPDGLMCEQVEVVNPDQPMRFLIGWIPDFGMAYQDAVEYFGNITARAVWGADGEADLVPHEILPFAYDDRWPNYVCWWTAAANPQIVVQVTDDWFEARQWRPNSQLSFSFYAPGADEPLVGPESFQADENGTGFIGLWDYGVDAIPGDSVVVTDGVVTKELTLEPLTYDLLDVTEGILSGTAPGPYEPDGRLVSLGLGFPGYDWVTDVQSDSEGNWAAAYGGSIPMDLHTAYAQIFDEDGDVSEVRPARVEGEVRIDILPGIRPNLFACRLTSAWLPVAVLSGEGFDATQLDTDSIRFGRTGTEAPVLRTGPNERPLAYAMDVNRDGLKDMVYVFRFGDTGFSCADIPAGQRYANVEGKLTGKVGMVDVLGVDVVRLFRLFGQ